MGLLINPLEFIGSALDYMGNSFSSGLNSLGEKLWNGLGNLSSGIQNVYNKLLSLVDFLSPSSQNFILKLAFIPSEDKSLNSVFDNVKLYLNNKIGLEYDLNSLTSVSEGTLENIEINIMGINATVVDFSFLNSIKFNIHSWVRGMVYPLLLLYHVNQIYFLIRGTKLFDSLGAKGRIE